MPPANLSSSGAAGSSRSSISATLRNGSCRRLTTCPADEPTASLDAGNRAVVVELINEAKARGAAVVGIFHDDEVREAVADRGYDLSKERAAA